MNARFRDRLSFCSAIGIGLGVSTGHPMGIIAATGMPVACLSAGTRKAVFKSTLVHYVAGIRPMIPDLDRYFGQSGTSLNPAAMLTLPILASVMAHPTVIVGINNTFWVDHTTIPRYQATALRGWAKLFHVPYFLAVNS
jgi:hypothetical protein